MKTQQQKVPGCSCQLCNPTYVDIPAPPIRQDPDDDTEWPVSGGNTSGVKTVPFMGKVVTLRSPAGPSRN